MYEPGAIQVVNARVHNLKGVSCTLPAGRLSVVTGPSGSGKSSLVFDTIWSEAQRRYTQSLPAYVRQILGVWEKPDVERIEGLSPAVALDARPSTGGPRSTVGTATEINDFLRALYARLGVPHCPSCGAALSRTTREDIVKRLCALPEGRRLMVTAPLGACEPSALPALWTDLRREGFLRVVVGEDILSVEGDAPRGAGVRGVAVVVDRLRTSSSARQRIAEAVETALLKSGGLVGARCEDVGTLEFCERFQCARCAVTLPALEPALFAFNSPRGACPRCTGLGVVRGNGVCQDCGGARLGSIARAVRLGGATIHELSCLPLDAALEFFQALGVPPEEVPVVAPLLREITRRLELLLRLGLPYVTLARTVPTLSGGEHQRLRLAMQIGADLSGILYVLDEPTVGLHPAETERLLSILKELCARGNAVVVVEHDLDVIRAAEHVVDLGPGAGPDGGRVMAAGTPAEIAAHTESLTGRYLSGACRLAARSRRRRSSRMTRYVEVRGASAHNLKGIDVRFPLRALTCVTGVSGSGKSTLVIDTLYRGLARMLHGAGSQPASHTALRIEGDLRRVVAVDQSPIGRSARSTPATYTGLFAVVRQFFARLPLARMRGYGAERFSFNAKGGRCETCRGEGVRRVSMQLLPDVSVPCEVCEGRRFNAETLEVRYRGLSIAGVLDLTVSEAGEIFAPLARVAERLVFLRDIGLGYLRLGQRADTLSGGEAQRLKLSRELSRAASDTLYVLDEPTTGLHLDDMRLLCAALEALIAHGNTVVVVEHNVEFMRCADHIIDLGPGGGGAGGELLAAGTPEEVARAPRSVTAKYL